MPEGSGRRLPVYVVLDTSGSMSGEAIEAVRQGLRILITDLKTSPATMETAYVSVITFSSTAQQVVPLTDVNIFTEPTLDASGSTSLGEALKLLNQCIDKEVHKNIAGQQKGDYKPLVVIMTDGQPTDSWEAAADQLKARRLGNIIALAAGPGADENPLKRITEIVFRIEHISADQLKQFFKVVSQSAKVQSVKQDPNAPLTLPPPPPGITVVP